MTFINSPRKFLAFFYVYSMKAKYENHKNPTNVNDDQATPDDEH
jgi:hypothetical protein